MVGNIFRVIFTRYAQRRRREIFDFEENLNGRRYARKVQRAIDTEARKLEKLPESHPAYLDHDSDYEVKYTKALDYKILFRILKKVGEVIILTIRNDAEDPDKIKDEVCPPEAPCAVKRPSSVLLRRRGAASRSASGASALAGSRLQPSGAPAAFNSLTVVPALSLLLLPTRCQPCLTTADSNSFPTTVTGRLLVSAASAARWA